MSIEIIIASIAGILIGAVGGYCLFRYVIKQTYNNTIKDAEKEAENIKSKKLLEVKEKFLNKFKDQISTMGKEGILGVDINIKLKLYYKFNFQ